MQTSSVRILLIEDNPADVFLVQQALREHGVEHTLEVVADRVQMVGYLEKLRANPDSCPEIILLDLNLPGTTGTEILRAIRGIPHCSGTPVIVVTSSDAHQDRTEAAAFGISHYFRKPVDLDEFLALGALIKQYAAV